MDSDIKRTIERIDERIAKLCRIKEMLLDEFASVENNANPVKRGRSKEVSVKATRKQQVVKFILSNGPTARKELISGSRLPLGTVSYLLNDKKTFRRLDDGRWDVTESLKTVGR